MNMAYGPYNGLLVLALPMGHEHCRWAMNMADGLWAMNIAYGPLLSHEHGLRARKIVYGHEHGLWTMSHGPLMSHEHCLWAMNIAYGHKYGLWAMNIAYGP